MDSIGKWEMDQMRNGRNKETGTRRKRGKVCDWAMNLKRKGAMLSTWI